MRRRIGTISYWPMVLAALLATLSILAFALVLLLGIFGAVAPSSDALPLWAGVGLLLAFSSFPICGAIIASHQPTNPIGWIFCAMGLSVGFSSLAEAYVTLARLLALPATAWVLWIRDWVGIPFLLLPPLAFLVFPTGAPLSSRWRAVLWIAAASLLAQVVAKMVESWLLYALPQPFSVPPPIAEVARTLGEFGVLGVAVYPVAAASLVARYRVAGRIERQQLKWFMYAGALIAVAFLLLGLSIVLGSEGARIIDLGPAGEILWFFAVLVTPAAPIAAAIAIFRYRLYDIDLLIRRTLVYGVLSTTLALTYVGGVILIGAALRSITAGSDLAVAVSTLAVLALFQPLRRTIQDAVDRRFFRFRYDAVRTLDAFGLRLRDEVDIEAVRADLLEVVRDTVHPAHASLWLRRPS